MTDTAIWTLCGSWAQLWVNGVPIGELKRIDIKVKAIRKDVQMGISVDSKLVGLKGTGVMTLYKVYTRFYDAFEDLKSGKDTRLSIIAKLQDPDAYGGQCERYAIDNVAIGEFPFADWTMGETVECDIPFTFTPSDMRILDRINTKEETA